MAVPVATVDVHPMSEVLVEHSAHGSALGPRDALQRTPGARARPAWSETVGVVRAAGGVVGMFAWRISTTESAVETRDSRRILIVAHKSVATRALVDTVRRRTEAGPCTFALLIPDASDPAVDAWTLRSARRMFSKMIGAPVDGVVAQGEDAYAGIAAAVQVAEYDEIMLSIVSGPGAGWLHEDVPARVE